MKTVFSALAIVFLTHFGVSAAEDVGIGQEQIKSIRFPKISVSADYNLNRYGKFLGESEISSKIEGAWGFGLAFDVGLLKYLNAGAGFSTTIGNVMKHKEPIQTRLTLFAKPIIPINERMTIFGRFGGGLSVMFLNPHMHFATVADASVKRNLKATYGDQDYGLINPGGNALATVGIEFFPFSRMGLALEWGIQADIYYISKTKFIEQVLGKETVTKNAPNAIKYLAFEMPLTLTLHFIL